MCWYKEIADFFECSESIVYNWIRRPEKKKRPPRFTLGKEIRFPKEEFVKWLAMEQVEMR